MSLIQQFSAANDVTFIDRVQQAMVFTAVNISSEVGTTTNHANRMLLVKAVLAAPALYAPLFAQSVIALNGAADGSILTDQQLKDGCAANWNAHAGPA